jgi:cell division protein FtsW
MSIPSHLKPPGTAARWWSDLRHRSSQSPDYALLAAVVGMVVIGLVVLYSASSVVGVQTYGSTTYFVTQQVLKGILPGFVLMWLAARLPYHWWFKLAVPVAIVTVLLLIATFIPGIGAEHRNIRSWIDIGPLSFQPGELAKLALVLYFGRWIASRRQYQLADWWGGAVPFLVFLGILSILLMLQPDLGTLIVVAAVALSMFALGGAAWRHLTAIIGVGLAGVVLLAMLAPYRAARLTAFINPSVDPQGIGYHVNQAMLAVGAGGLLGRGLGQSVQKYNYLPEAQGDSVFAVMAEELGFILSLAFLALWLWLLLRAWRVATTAPDRFSQLVAAGITAWLAWQSFFNIGGMLRVVPLTGLPLPFISYGGTAMLVNLVVVGILLSISRSCRVLPATSRPR